MSVATKIEIARSENSDFQGNLSLQPSASPEVSVVIAALNEAGNIGPLISGLKSNLNDLGITFEVVVIDGGSRDSTVAEAIKEEALCFLQKRPGYGGAVREGFLRARGKYVLTLDSDLSHPPALVKELWQQRSLADVVIGSRFVDGGSSEAPPHRRLLSKVLNWVFSTILDVPIKDSSSGYRLYRKEVLTPDAYKRENFNILQDILIKAYSDGFSVKEVPLNYLPRGAGESHVSLIKFCKSYLPTLARLWILRNSIMAADYDHRAYKSRNPVQRFWQHQRYKIINSFLPATGELLDVGSGSSRLIQDHPDGIALDLAFHKLRFLKKTNSKRVMANTTALPFLPQRFQRVVHSQVLPYVEKNPRIIGELNRVMSVGGTLVIGTTDFGTLAWRVIGFLYDKLMPTTFGYQQISHYTRHELMDLLANNGFRIVSSKYVGGAELIVKAVKIEDV